jgi:hypothetical protein
MPPFDEASRAPGRLAPVPRVRTLRAAQDGGRSAWQRPVPGALAAATAEIESRNRGRRCA